MVQSGHVGHAAVIPEELNNSAAHALIMFRNLKVKTEPYFLNYQYQTLKAKKKIENITTGNTIKHILASDMQKFLVDIPSYEEQKEIAGLFRTLDTIITLHQCKFDFLFQVDVNDWEQRKLGEMANIVGGGTPSTGVSQYWDGDIDWYAPAEIADQIYVDSSQRKITELGYNNSSAKILPPGTVLFTSRAGIGKTAILAREGCTNQGFQSIVPHKDELDSYFIFTRTEELKYFGETVGAGSTFVEVSGKQMANMELMMPKIFEEQKEIGVFFSKIDNLITLHQCKYILCF